MIIRMPFFAAPVAATAIAAVSILSGDADAGVSPPPPPAGCINAHVGCSMHFTVLETICGAGAHAVPAGTSYFTLGEGVASVNLRRCGGGETTVTTGTDLCSLDGYNDNVCGVDIVLEEASCGLHPAVGCRGAENSLLLIKKSDSDAKNKLKWKWSRGTAVTLEELGDPTTDTSFALCVYDHAAVVIDATLPASATLWKPLGTKGFGFKDASATAKILSGAEGKSKASALSSGLELPAPYSAEEYFSLTSEILVQLVDQEGGCFESVFDTTNAKKNTAKVFVAKNAGVAITTTTSTTTTTTTTAPSTSTTTLPTSTSTTTTSVTSSTTTLPEDVLSDDFNGASLDPSWTVLHPSLVTITVSGGSLRLVPTMTGGPNVWFNSGEGPLIYKDVTGDFDVYSNLTVRDPGNTANPPPPEYRLAGILARDPASTPASSNTVHTALGAGSAMQGTSYEYKSTDDSVSNWMATPTPSATAQVRLRRSGTTFEMYWRALPADMWTMIFSVVRADMPATLQVGPMIYSVNAPPSIEALFDDIVFQ